MEAETPQLWFCLLSYQCHHSPYWESGLYTRVARQYQYRERDEPDNIYHYVEDYYANAQDELSYVTMVIMITLRCTLSIITHSMSLKAFDCVAYCLNHVCIS